MSEEVLIVGAGPAGLVLGCELLRRGIPVRLIDQKEGPTSQSRALGIQARTLEHFEKMGILPSILEAGIEARHLKLQWNGRTALLSLESLQAPYPFLLLLAQSETERILLHHLASLGGKVEWNTSLVSLTEKELTLQKPDDSLEKCERKWLVGCDGAHSTLRHLLNLPFEGVEFSERFLLADVSLKSPHPLDEPHSFLNHKGLGVLIPFSKNPPLHRFIFPLPQLVEESAITTSSLLHMAQERGFDSEVEIAELIWVSVFQIHRRMATQWQQGRTFLVGDATHIHSPVGGQGMNTSIQDAFNLAWKLALVLQGASSESLLETYSLERMPIAQEVLKGTTKATRFLTFCQKWAPALFYIGIKLFTSIPPLKQKIIEGISEIALRYPCHALIQEESKGWGGPPAGGRAPDALLEGGKRLFDLFKSTRHVVLLFGEDPALKEQLHKEYGTCLEVHIIKDDKVKALYQATASSLYLIRPDGYIGYRSKTLNKESLFSYLKKLFNKNSI